MIEVILREDVQSLGKAGAMVRVKPGYARNYLLPRGLAYEATEGNKKRIAAETRAREVRAGEDRASAQEAAGRLESAVVTITAKAGEGERLFGSVTAQDIAEALEQSGHPVDKRRIELAHPIKLLGEHPVSIRLHSEVQAVVRVRIVPA
ncbi:MAG TPA: 50S ribosomal protein L9 [Gemmatimonadales bacterium]|nr:50S ribosomal protein L9 [Gemmatimonadales bacterium]